MEGQMEGQVQCRRRDGGGTDRGREGGMEGGMERDSDFTDSPECFGHYPGPILILFFTVTLASYVLFMYNVINPSFDVHQECIINSVYYVLLCVVYHVQSKLES